VSQTAQRAGGIDGGDFDRQPVGCHLYRPPFPYSLRHAEVSDHLSAHDVSARACAHWAVEGPGDELERQKAGLEGQGKGGSSGKPP
jgi:hypothetical protein